jgi:hypothetical protein
MASTTPAARPWLLAQPAPREGLAFALILACLSCLPVLAASLPQMGDYPAHLARYHVMLESGRNPLLDAHYAFEWKWTGNLGVDLLIYPLAKLIGLEPAGRLIVALIPVLTGCAMATLEWTLRRRVGLATLLALAFIWSPALLLGFLNFALSFTLALFALALWIKLEGKTWRWAPFVPIGLLVWLCHVSGWGILGIMVFGYEWSRSKSWRAVLAPWPLLAPLLPLPLGGGTKGDLTWGKSILTYKYAIWLKAMRDSSVFVDLATPVIVFLLALAALIWRRFDGRLGWAALALLLLSLVMPRHIVGGDYADYRLIACGLALLCLALGWNAPRMVLLLGASLFLVRLGITTLDWRRDSAEMEQVLGALDQLPRGARLASAVRTVKTDWPSNPFEHVAGYATVRRDALTNANFALPKVHMLRLRQPFPYRFIDPSQRLLIDARTPIDLARFVPAQDMDYLWYHGARAPDTLPPGAKEVFRTERSVLLKLARGPAGR